MCAAFHGRASRLRRPESFITTFGRDARFSRYTPQGSRWPQPMDGPPRWQTAMERPGSRAATSPTDGRLRGSTSTSSESPRSATIPSPASTSSRASQRLSASADASTQTPRSLGLLASSSSRLASDGAVTSTHGTSAATKPVSAASATARPVCSSDARGWTSTVLTTPCQASSGARSAGSRRAGLSTN